MGVQTPGIAQPGMGGHHEREDNAGQPLQEHHLFEEMICVPMRLVKMLEEQFFPAIRRDLAADRIGVHREEATRPEAKASERN